MDNVGLAVRTSRMEYEAGAKSLRAHLLSLDTLHQLYWKLRQIHQDMERPGSSPMTSMDLRARADRRRQNANFILANGGKVRQEYMNDIR